MILESKIIAIDFDGTVVEDAYPKIGKEMPFAFESLRLLEQDGHRLILWTVRSGKRLTEAVEYCGSKGITFYAVNENFEGENFSESGSRKINADVFVDDRNVGGFIGWGEVYQQISKKDLPPRKKKKFFSFGS